MRRNLFIMVALLLSSATAFAATVQPSDSLRYFFPDEGVVYNEDIPAPEQFFGFSIGDWHLQHHQLIDYFRCIAENAPDRVLLERTGRTHGNRNKILVTITAPGNFRRLDEIRNANRANALGEKRAGDNAPVVVFLGYSIHGNEPSGANCAPLLAYHLAAGRGEAVDRLLEDTVILIDPMLNPDGLDRFAAWSNNHRGRIPNPDPSHREHTEPWPSGRTNYYWFDLNRDWLPAVHPETKAHLDTYHDWRPAIVGDFHEMQTNRTYFFQPGIPERANPLIPANNQDLTRRISEYHAQALDEVGSLYFTEERFDDFYVGKGSTYPDINGSVGILFEQASSRGHTQNSDNGLITLRIGVRNQIRTSLSTINSAVDLRRDLLAHQYDSARSAVAEVGNLAAKGYLFTSPGAPVRLAKLTALLSLHRIDFQLLDRDFEYAGIKFPAGASVFVPTNQPSQRLVTTMFETRTEFRTQAFYDTSAWNIAEAYGLTWTALDLDPPRGVASSESNEFSPDATARIPDGSVAVAFDPTHHHAHRAVSRLLEAGARVRVALDGFTAAVGEDIRAFPAGSIVVPFAIQSIEPQAVATLAQRFSEEDSVSMFGIRSGLTPSGIDLGSPNLRPVSNPRILLVAGIGNRPNHVGHLWHLLDREHGIPVTVAEASRLNRATLERHNVLIYSDVKFKSSDDIQRWVEGGGTLILAGNAIKGVNESKLATVELLKAEFPEETVAFADAREHSSRVKISGAIVRAAFDLTHPIAFGLTSDQVSIFRDNQIFLKPTGDPFSTPGRYVEHPVVSGYVSEPNQEAVAGSAAVQFHAVGEGRMILLPDATAFRGFWHGSARLMLNAIFFGPQMKPDLVAIDDA